MGPWGFAYRGFDSQNYFAVLGVWSFLVLATTLAMLWLAANFAGPRCGDGSTQPRSNLTSQAWVLLELSWTLSLILVCAVRFPVFLNLGPLLLLALNAQAEKPKPDCEKPKFRIEGLLALMLAVSLALSALLKFNFFIGATVAVLAVTLDDVLRLRRVPRVGIAYLIALAGFWRGAGQSWGAFIPYLRNAIEIARGYSGAMSFDPPTISADLIGFLVPAGLILALVIWTTWRRDKWRSLFLSMGLAGGIFLVFKSAFIRHYFHFSMATVYLFPLAWVWLPWIARQWSTAPRALRWAMRGTCAALACLSASVAIFTYGQYRPPTFFQQAGALLGQFPADVGRALHPGRTRDELTKEHESKLADIRQRAPLPPLSGTVDVYPVRQSVVLANDLPYAPRPVFQSYAAYTPALAQLNADHLLTPRAAETILFDIFTIDQRFPALDDGPSWPRLLTLYDVQTTTRDFIVLHRSAMPRAARLEPLTTLTGEFNSPLPLPDGDDLLWAEIDLPTRPAGDVLALLYKSPLVSMTINLPHQPAKSFRLVPEMARGGFLLSPLVEDRPAWQSLADGTWRTKLANRKLAAITLNAGEHQSTFYNDQFEVRLSKLIVDTK